MWVEWVEETVLYWMDRKVVDADKLTSLVPTFALAIATIDFPLPEFEFVLLVVGLSLASDPVSTSTYPWLLHDRSIITSVGIDESIWILLVGSIRTQYKGRIHGIVTTCRRLGG